MEKKLKEEIVALLKQILEIIKQPRNEKIEKITFSIQDTALYLGIGHEKIRELVNKKIQTSHFSKLEQKH